MTRLADRDGGPEGPPCDRALGLKLRRELWPSRTSRTASHGVNLHPAWGGSSGHRGRRQRVRVASQRRRTSAAGSSAPTITSSPPASASRSGQLAEARPRLPNVEIKTLATSTRTSPPRASTTSGWPCRDVQARLPGSAPRARRQGRRRDRSHSNHWHALATVWGHRPASTSTSRSRRRTVWEGRKMVEATARHNKIVEVGTMNRSRPAVKKRSSSFTKAGSARSTWRAACFSRVRRSTDTRTARCSQARMRADAHVDDLHRPTTRSTVEG